MLNVKLYGPFYEIVIMLQFVLIHHLKTLFLKHNGEQNFHCFIVHRIITIEYPFMNKNTYLLLIYNKKMS